MLQDKPVSYMAQLGVRSLAELRGRTELLQIPLQNPHHLKLDWLESLPVETQDGLVTESKTKDLTFFEPSDEPVFIDTDSSYNLGFQLVGEKTSYQLKRTVMLDKALVHSSMKVLN